VDSVVPKRFLKADEIAITLNIGRAKAYNMMANGDLPIVRIGRAVRVPAEALDAWIARQCSGSEAKPKTL
jgi:excisionase family DNA binding protein